MAYNALNNLIDAYIYPNGVQAITGSILNNVLKAMVSQLGGGYNLMGVAAPASSPAVNDEPLAYFAATAGTYTNFDGIVLAAGEVAVLLTSGNGSWSKQTIYNVPTGTADLANTAGFITSAVNSLVNYYTKGEIDTALEDYTTLSALATSLADYYNKSAIDAQMATRYTKTEVDTKFGDYYRKTETYNKTEVDTKFGGYYRKAETYDKAEVDSIVAALSRQEYIVAWDGLAAPDVSAIPAGVTVTYSGTTYTGTLAASASTVNKIYMVWNGTAYDMYATSQDGGYSWVPMGTTSVDLSQYATKAEVSQLRQETSNLSVTTQDIVGNSTYNDDNGSVLSAADYYRSDKIPFVANAVTNGTDAPSNGETLYWSNNVYLGYTRYKYTETPETWVSADHTLPVTHVAFCWYGDRNSALFYIDPTAILPRKEYEEDNGIVSVIFSSTYNDSNGRPMYYAGRARSPKIEYIENPITNANSAGSEIEILFWNNDTYLGYSGTSFNAPETWVSADHTLPVTHVAFCWKTIPATTVYYKTIDSILKNYIAEQILISKESIIAIISEKENTIYKDFRGLLIFRDIVPSSAWNDDNGNSFSYPGYYRTAKIPFIENALTNAMSVVVDIRETLYWHDDTYLGFTKNNAYTEVPQNWVHGDHTLSVTHIAFSWRSEEEIKDIYYTTGALPFADKSYVNNKVAELKDYTDNSLSNKASKDYVDNVAEGFNDTVDTINEALSELSGSVPAGAITGDNVWTGANTFAQPIEGVPGTNSDNAVILSQLWNAGVSHRFINAKDFGVLPTNTGAQNATALNNAISGGGKTVIVSEPGVYDLGATILLGDNTTIVFGKGVTMRKSANYQNMFRNAGASSRSYNKNISLIGLTISVNGKSFTPDVDGAIFGLRGEVSFLCTENVKIYDFCVEDLGSYAYAIQINQSSKVVIQDFVVKGRKDAIHISSIDAFVIRNGYISNSDDDGLALNASDWVSSNCVDGDITNGLIENIYDLYQGASSYMCRLLTGAWVDWTLGMSIHRGDTIVHNGRIYRAYTATPTNTIFTSSVEPTIDTFTGKQQDGEFYWKLMRDDKVYYSNNIRNVEFRNIHEYAGRVGFSEQVETDPTYEYNRSLYPTVAYNDYPTIDISIKGFVFDGPNKVAFGSSGNVNSYYIIEGMSGDGAALNIEAPVNTAIKKRVDARNVDFRKYAGPYAMVRNGVGSIIRLSDAVSDGAILTDCDGRLISNSSISQLPESPEMGDYVIHAGTPKIFNGSSWTSLF